MTVCAPGARVKFTKSYIKTRLHLTNYRNKHERDFILWGLRKKCSKVTVEAAGVDKQTAGGHPGHGLDQPVGNHPNYFSVGVVA